MNIDSLHIDPTTAVIGALALTVAAYLVRWWWTAPVVGAIDRLAASLHRDRRLPPAP